MIIWIFFPFVFAFVLMFMHEELDTRQIIPEYFNIHIRC